MSLVLLRNVIKECKMSHKTATELCIKITRKLKKGILYMYDSPMYIDSDESNKCTYKIQL